MAQPAAPSNEVARRRPRTFLGTVLLIALFAQSHSSWASATMRCGTRLIDKGSLQAEVIKRCGRPYAKYRRYWLYRQRNVVYRVYFNRNAEVSYVKREIVF